MGQQWAVVTGGAQGLGLQMARRLAADGFAVAVLDLAGPELERTGQEHGFTVLEADVTDEAAVDAALGSLGGTLRVLVNNAGIVDFSSLDETTLEDFRRVLDVNLTGTLIAARCAVRRMTDGGSVVNLSSINGLNPVPGTGSYGASKAAVAALTEQMALEWSTRGVRVNAVAPGIVFGGMGRSIYEDEERRATRSASIPARRLASEEDIADAVAFLAGPQSSYVTGQTIVVDGGVSLLAVAGLTGRA